MRYFKFVFWFTFGAALYHLFIGKDFVLVFTVFYFQFCMALWFWNEDRKLCKKSK